MREGFEGTDVGFRCFCWMLDLRRLESASRAQTPSSCRSLRRPGSRSKSAHSARRLEMRVPSEAAVAPFHGSHADGSALPALEKLLKSR